MPLLGGAFGASVGIFVTVLKNSLLLQRKLAGMCLKNVYYDIK
jgi:hypothetical protein